MYNFIVILILIGTVFTWSLRFLKQSGLNIPDNKVFEWITDNTKTYTGDYISKGQIFRIFIIAIFIRILLYCFGALSYRIFMDETVGFTFQKFLDSWTIWDSSNYIDLAKKGYSNCLVDGKHLYLAFFPLYPYLIHLLHYVIPNYQIVALIISLFSYCIGSCYFYAFIAEEYGHSIAKKAFIYLSIFPFSFFFGGIMTESLFFCTTAAAFYYIRKHKWFIAGIIGCLASLTRLHGILLVGVFGIEFFIYYKPFEMIRDKRIKELVRVTILKGFYIFLIPVGTIIYLYINYKVDADPFRFMLYQKLNWNHQSTFFGNAIREVFHNAFTLNQVGLIRASIFLPEAVLFILVVILIIYGLRRHNLLYTAYLMVYTILNFSVTWLISGGRYILCAITLFIILAEIGENHKEADKWITIISAIGLGIFMSGYLMYKQIM